MNSLSRTEFRNIGQVRRLQTLLDAKHDKIAAAKRGAERHVCSAPTQPEPVQMCAPDDDVPPALTARQLIAAGLAWLVAMLASLWLCTDAGMRFLDAIWRLA